MDSGESSNLSGWDQLVQSSFKKGFLEGKSTKQTERIQKAFNTGFDEGFKDGVTSGRALAKQLYGNNQQ